MTLSQHATVATVLQYLLLLPAPPQVMVKRWDAASEDLTDDGVSAETVERIRGGACKVSACSLQWSYVGYIQLVHMRHISVVTVCWDC